MFQLLRCAVQSVSVTLSATPCPRGPTHAAFVPSVCRWVLYAVGCAVEAMDESKSAAADPRIRAKIREAFDLFDKEKHGTVIQEYVLRKAVPVVLALLHTVHGVRRRWCGLYALLGRVRHSRSMCLQGSANHHAIPGRIPNREGCSREDPSRRTAHACIVAVGQRPAHWLRTCVASRSKRTSRQHS